MTVNDKDNENEPAGGNKELVKKEEEEASSYYASEDSHEKDSTESDMNKPIPLVDEEKEEMNLLKAVAYLGFGMAAIAIVFMLFFLRSLDERVLDVGSSMNKLDAKFAPFKKEVDEKFARVNGDFQQLKNKIGKYERMLAIMELKRALVSIQEVTNDASPEVRAKADDVMVSIKTLLQQLGEGTAGEAVIPAESAPSFEPESVPEPAVEAAAEVEAATEVEAAAEEAAPEQPEEETPVGEIELESEDESVSESEDEEEE